MKILFTSLLFLTSSLGFTQEFSFSKAALEEHFISLEGESISFKNIIAPHRGHSIVLKIWASWCKDCLADLPNAKDVKTSYKDVIFINLSLDRDIESWKRGVKKHKVDGENYFFTKAWKESAFCESIKLDWIPRYMVINTKGEISLFKSITAKDKKLIEILKKSL